MSPMRSDMDRFVCPHEGCDFTVDERCRPHTESIGDQSEASGSHCWNTHNCTAPHPDAWQHMSPPSRFRRCIEQATQAPGELR